MPGPGESLAPLPSDIEPGNVATAQDAEAVTVELVQCQELSAETPEGGFAFDHGNGRIEVARDAKDARNRCTKYLGSLSLEETEVVLRLRARGAAMKAQQDLPRVASKPETPKPTTLSPKPAPPKSPQIAAAKTAIKPQHDTVAAATPEVSVTVAADTVVEESKQLAAAEKALEAVIAQSAPEAIEQDQGPTAFAEVVEAVAPAVEQPIRAGHAQTEAAQVLSHDYVTEEVPVAILEHGMNEAAIPAAHMSAEQVVADVSAAEQAAEAHAQPDETLEDEVQAMAAEGYEMTVRAAIEDEMVPMQLPAEASYDDMPAMAGVVAEPDAAEFEEVPETVLQVHDQLVALIEAESAETNALQPTHEAQPTDSVDIEFATLVREMQSEPEVPSAVSAEESESAVEVLPMAEIIAAAPAQPLSRTIQQLKVRFEHNVETPEEPVVVAIRELAELVAAAEPEMVEGTRKYRPTPQMTQKLLQVLESLGYERPDEVLLDYVRVNGFGQLVEELTALAWLSLITPENKPGLQPALQIGLTGADDDTPPANSFVGFLFRALGVQPALATSQAD